MARTGGGREEVERQCALTRKRRPVDELLRFVLDPDGRVVPDLKGRLPGRGVWLTAASDVVASAVSKGVFPRAFRRSVEADQALPDMVEGLLRRSALGLLSLANKAGNVIVGFDAVGRALASDRAVGLVHASGASPDGCRKLDRRFLREGAPFVGRAMVRCFDTNELSLALGRPNVVHAALMQGGASAGFIAAAERLERFRAGSAAFAAA